MKIPQGWRLRLLPRGSAHKEELLDAAGKHVTWMRFCTDDWVRELEKTFCKMFTTMAQSVPVPNDLLELAFRNRPMSEEDLLRMAAALCLALKNFEDSCRG